MVLTRSEPRRVLLLPSEQGFTAPEWEPEDGVWFQLQARVTNAFATQALGLPVTLLEAQIGSLVKSNGRRVKVYFLEGHDPVWQPPQGSHWAGPGDLPGVTLTVPEMKPLLEEWLAGPVKAAPGQPPAPGWIYPGWLDEVETWVGEKLAAQGIHLTERLEQLKSWSISCLLRFQTSQGDYFFKATPQVFQKEPVFTAFLAEHFPAIVPRVAALNAERGWLLMPDFQATNIRDINDISLWEEAVRRYARFQVDSLGLTGVLFEKGCRDRRLDRLFAQFEAVAYDTPRMVPNPEAGLTPDEIRQVNDLIPVIKAQIAELAAFGLPDALIHGDLNANNIALTASGEIIYYDWTDLSISHPFFDLDALLEWGAPFEDELPDWKKRVRNAYLAEWTGFLPLPELIRAFELSARLAIMVQTLNYHWIVTRIEESGRWEFANDVPYYFRRLLEFQAENLLE
jgi:hypothetical protein